MKFTNEFCPVCAGNDLEVYSSTIDYATDPATGYIFFICLGCAHEFEVIKEAEVNT
jgi:hypothetical protein